LTKRAAALAAINLYQIFKKENTSMKIKTNVKAGATTGDIRIGSGG
jgi:hypothetical protein